MQEVQVVALVMQEAQGEVHNWHTFAVSKYLLVGHESLHTPASRTFPIGQAIQFIDVVSH